MEKEKKEKQNKRCEIVINGNKYWMDYDTYQALVKWPERRAREMYKECLFGSLKYYDKEKYK